MKANENLQGENNGQQRQEKRIKRQSKTIKGAKQVKANSRQHKNGTIK